MSCIAGLGNTARRPCVNVTGKNNTQEMIEMSTKMIKMVNLF
jgi:hypothetical protein